MATTLALAMRASMSAGGVVSGANQASTALDKMARHAQQTAQNMSVLKNIAIGAMVAKGIGMAANAMQSAAQAAAQYVGRVTQAIDAMKDLAERTGMGVESLQALQMAAKLSGVDDVTTAVQKLSVAIGNAAESGKTDAFTRLGLDFAELQTMSPEAQFRAIQAAIAALPTPAERAAAAVSIFGRAGVELLPLMNQNLEEIEERMRRLGAIVSEEQVGAVADMNDALDMVKATFDGIIGQVVGNLAPVVTAMAETFLEFVEGYNSVSGDGGNGIANAITKGLLSVLEGLARVVDGAVSGFNGISSSFDRISSRLWTIAKIFAPGMAATITVAGLGASALMSGDAAAGGVGATEFVQGIRRDFENSQTPEAKKEREERQERRRKEQEDAAKTAQEATAAAANEARLEEDAKEVSGQTRTASEKHAEAMKRLDELRAGNFIDEETYERAKAEENKKLQEAHDKAAREAEQAMEGRRRASEKHAEEMKQLDELRAGGFIDEETYKRGKAKADRRLQEARQKAERAEAEAGMGSQEAHDKAVREAEQAMERQKKASKAAAAIGEKSADKQEQIAEIDAARAEALVGKSNEALKANDIRSSEGMAQFLALASGREDPAIVEYRKQTQKLEELKAELRALQQERVDILMGAA